MKKGTKKALAMLMLLVLAIGLACSAAAEKTVSSPVFTLPQVFHRPTPEPVAEPEEPDEEPTAGPTAEPTATPEPEKNYVVNAKGFALNYRVSPDGEVVAALEDGTEIAVTKLGEEWSEILLDGKTYFVQTQYIIEKAKWEEMKAEEAKKDEEVKPTEAPAAEATEEPQEPAITEEMFRAALASVTISVAEETGVVVYGESITLVADVPELLSVANMQWQERAPEGEWISVPGANGMELTLEISEQNAQNEWRIQFSIG